MGGGRGGGGKGEGVGSIHYNITWGVVEIYHIAILHIEGDIWTAHKRILRYVFWFGQDHHTPYT